MGQLGMAEILAIFLVALLVFGPKKLPELGKSLGKGLREFKRATNDLKSSWESQVKDIDREVSSAARDIKNVGKDIDNSIRQERPDSPSGAANGRASTAPTTPSASTPAADANPAETPDAATEDKSPTAPTTPSASTTADDAVPPETPEAGTEAKSPEQPA